jgi:hypothetical protein
MKELICLVQLERMGLNPLKPLPPPAPSAQQCEARMLARFPELAYREPWLECAICMSLFLDPMSLSCGHRFCRSCLVRMSLAEGGEDLQEDRARASRLVSECDPALAVKCPECRVLATVSRKLPCLATLCKQSRRREYLERLEAEERYMDGLDELRACALS